MKVNFQFSFHLAAVLAFLASFGFFQIAYPYHMIRREQMSLFLFDWKYIRQTYIGCGWLTRFLGDFLEQFYNLPVVGPFVVALLLTAIGVVVFLIVRKFWSKWFSLALAIIVFAWSFMRETGNLYVTRYTISVLGYLSLLLLALQLNKIWSKIPATIFLLFLGFWALGAPIQKNYGKAWGKPRLEYERMIGLDTEVARENWDKVLKLSRKDIYMVEASYCYNLALAMKGEMGNKLLDHSQNEFYGLLFRVTGSQSTFSNCLAGEAWYHLGAITIAEQSAITSLQASPNHTGTRYLLRLAKVSLISENKTAAQKYLNMLSKTLFYGKWARSILSGKMDEETSVWLDKARSNLAVTDFVHLGNNPRSVLLDLLETNPENILARNYLLCHDLMRYDLEQFMEDYSPNMIKARLYHEAVLIWLSQQRNLSEDKAAQYGVESSTLKRMDSFLRMPSKYKNTYWYYYLEKLNASAQ